MATTSHILTGVKKILVTPFNGDNYGTQLELSSIIADTVEITQDDPETETIDCETSDSPIIEATKLGKYTISMDSADINGDILTQCLGFTTAGTGAWAAPKSYTARYAKIEIQMDSAEFVLPKVLLTSKIDASSLKTSVAKGNISGSAFDAKVKVGTGSAVETPFLVVEKPSSGDFPAVTLSLT